jgi:hypothetical protein
MRRTLGVVCLLVAVASPAVAQINCQDLGTAAPPGVIGPYVVTPFDQAPQAAIANGTAVTLIPGSPIPGDVITSVPVTKQAIGAGWATWSHGYTGVVYTEFGTTVTLTLPANTGAFYLYIEPNDFGTHSVTATANDGTTSGPIPVVGNSGANGFAFYTSTPGQYIATVTVDVDPGANGYAIGEFGAATGVAPIPTLGIVGLGTLVLLLAGAGIVLIRRVMLA